MSSALSNCLPCKKQGLMAKRHLCLCMDFGHLCMLIASQVPFLAIVPPKHKKIGADRPCGEAGLQPCAAHPSTFRNRAFTVLQNEVCIRGQVGSVGTAPVSVRTDSAKQPSTLGWDGKAGTEMALS